LTACADADVDNAVIEAVRPSANKLAEMNVFFMCVSPLEPI
jgi:hypothetical protein